MDRLTYSTIATLLLLLWVTPAAAASLSVSGLDATVNAGQLVTATVTLDTQGETINALQGTLTYPPDLFSVEDISDAASLVSFWIQPPQLTERGVAFAGILPGGYQGAHAQVLQVHLRVLRTGTGSLHIVDALTLRNDGRGTATIIHTPVTLVAALGALGEPSIEHLDDHRSPESFLPIVGKNSAIFGGDWFIAFSARDKQSGIDHYDISESFPIMFGLFKRWYPATNPYRLRDQSLRSIISIRAVDRSGNMRVATIAPQRQLFTGLPIMAATLCLAGIFFVVLIRHRRP